MLRSWLPCLSRGLGSCCWRSTRLRKRTTERRRQVRCCSEKGRNNCRTLAEKGVACVFTLPEEGRSHSLYSDRPEELLCRSTSRRPRDSMYLMYEIFRVFNFRGLCQPRKYFDNENFQIYGIYIYMEKGFSWVRPLCSSALQLFTIISIMGRLYILLLQCMYNNNTVESVFLSACTYIPTAREVGLIIHLTNR